MRSARSSCWSRSVWGGVCGAACLLPIQAVDATVVRFETDQGTIDLTLYDAIAPATVANFLNYVNTGRYDGTFFHRSVPGFVIQGGGFTLSPAGGFPSAITTDPPVVNEFSITNTRGTLAMAKLAAPEDGGPPNGGPDSATSQWFFNLGDNASNLDNQNGGFTVFARVMGDGMQVVDAIASLPRFDLDGASGSTFDRVPLENGATLFDQHVFVTSATPLDLIEGDADMDGFVGQADLDAVLLNWGDGGTAWDTGDFNGNNLTEQGDLDAVLLNWGAAAEPDFRGVVVPEPLSGTLLGGSALMLARRGRRKS